MALHATFHALVQDKCLPIKGDATNWTTTVTERFWDQGVAWVQAQLGANIALATLQAFDDAGSGTNTGLFDLIYSNVAAALIWRHLKGVDEELQVTKYNALIAETKELIGQIQKGAITVYDSAGAAVTVTTDGNTTMAWTQPNVEPAFRKARRDIDGELLGSEQDGSLDAW